MMLPDQLENIALRIKSGETTLLPTNAVWGISCDAFNENAIERIKTIKKSSQDQYFTLVVDSLNMLLQYIEMMPPRVETLLSLHNKPLTLIHKAKTLPDYLVDLEDSVAIRITQHPICKEVITILGNPIISTEASIEGEVVATSFDNISDYIKSSVDFIAPFPTSLINRKYKDLSVIARYDNEGELEFIRT